MSAEHLSPLELEEAAAGLPSVVGVHLEGCPVCRAKVATLSAASDALRASPQFHARLASVLQQTAEKAIARVDPETGELTISKRGGEPEAKPSPPMPTWRWLMPTLAFAASVAAVVFWPRPVVEDARLKGSAMVRIVGSDGREVEKARPGQTVELAVGSAGHAQGLVLSVDASGQIEVLWPRGATLSARVPPGAGAHLEPAFEVTPGSLKLFALFADGPFDVSAAQSRIAAAVAAARAAGKSPLQAELAATDGASVASVLLQVEP